MTKPPSRKRIALQLRVAYNRIRLLKILLYVYCYVYFIYSYCYCSKCITYPSFIINSINSSFSTRTNVTYVCAPLTLTLGITTPPQWDHKKTSKCTNWIIYSYTHVTALGPLHCYIFENPDIWYFCCSQSTSIIEFTGRNRIPSHTSNQDPLTVKTIVCLATTRNANQFPRYLSYRCLFLFH